MKCNEGVGARMAPLVIAMWQDIDYWDGLFNIPINVPSVGIASMLGMTLDNPT